MALIVNGQRIEQEQIEQEAERLRPRYEQVFAEMDPEKREAQLWEWSRENVIERVLLSQDAQNHGSEISEEEIDLALAQLKEQYAEPEQLYKAFDVDNDEQLRQELADQLRIERRLEQLCQDLPEPSEQAIRDYYEQHKHEYRTPDQVRVAHIVKYVNWQNNERSAYEAISKAYEEIKNGAGFEEVVDKYTDCADTGGDLGTVLRGQMVEEFEDVVFNLGVGQVSDIFRTRFGYHIAKVYDRKDGEVPLLEHIRGRIVEALKEKMREDAINDFIDSLRSKAKIEEV